MAQKIVIASGKGGVGKTSLCVGIGKALSSLGMRVLLIDCDCLRSLDVLTGVTEQMVYNFGDVIFGRCSAEAALYKNDGLSVVTCPDSYDNISDYSMKWLIGKYEKDFDYILLDAPAGIERGLHMALSVADRAIVISTPDLVCVRSACIAGREIEKAGVKNIRLVINRVSKRDVVRGRLLNFDSVIDATQIQLIGIVPEDPKIRLGSMGREIYKKGQVSYKALGNIAKRIVGQTAVLKV
jgi:septum site-determining protein MinD